MCGRPSVKAFRLPSVSGIESKLGLTVVKPSLQSFPEPPALHPPPVCKYVRNFSRFLTSSDLDLFN